MAKTFKGKLSIGRLSGASDDGYIQIELEDEISGTRVVEVQIGLMEFAKAITNFACRPCEFQLYGSVVGKRRELRDIVVPRPPSHKTDAIAWVQQHAPHELTNGWEVHSASDVHNSHRWVKGTDCVRVGLIRFVEG